ncbi:histone acetyltransferase Esa1p [Trichomonascus vanleenenianus]|uniref:histone acetyltransferase Esa1p n=1 Tax=Trichomonascus vanleenenianus TaxID=2268995 RepID=UPI003ECA9CFF
MVRLSRQLRHDQNRRPRRTAAPRRLADPLLEKDFWQNLYHANDLSVPESRSSSLNVSGAATPAVVRRSTRRSSSEPHAAPATSAAASQPSAAQLPPKGAPKKQLIVKLKLPSNYYYNNEAQKHVVIEEIEDSDEEPYRGVIAGPEASTAHTMPMKQDLERFEKAMKEARVDREDESSSDDEQLANEDYFEARRKISKIRQIHIGQYEIDTWYTAPFPEEYSRHHTLTLCEFCLKYSSSPYVAWRHQLKCQYRHPPGNEIYRDAEAELSVFEVDGGKAPLYCQNLCLLAKMFLDSKTLYYDVEPFMFYVLTSNNYYGCQFVGYFSKQKKQQRTGGEFNLSCIVTLPIFQKKKGYGQFLIGLSYLLSRREHTTGTPEKPLSNLGLASYTRYWQNTVCQYLARVPAGHAVSISDISQSTGMTHDDVIYGLETLRFLSFDPRTGRFAVVVDRAKLASQLEKLESGIHLDESKLIWEPVHSQPSHGVDFSVDSSTLDSTVTDSIATQPEEEVYEDEEEEEEEDPAVILDRLMTVRPVNMP